MATHWNDINAILQDLSLAQGRRVPAEIQDTIGQNEKPPRLYISEETEEEFFENCVSSGDHNAGPDLALIQQMLQEVSRPHEEMPETNENTRKNRNVAISSLLRGKGPVNTAKRIEKPGLCLQNTANMFKKKSTRTVESSYDLKPPLNNIENKTLAVEQTKAFVPSSRADDVYKGYIEQSKKQKQQNEDIWTRAEKQMKELDLKRKLSAMSTASSDHSSGSSGMDLVRLPQHRHLLYDECVVCEVLGKRRATIDQIKKKS